MGLRKKYIKPEINLIILDNSITLMMISNPPPLGEGGKSGSKGYEDPFKSPFGDKPFN
ncbi:MAG: hypothetical protein IPJ37_15810 [Bacteroidales bacterium]|nr:hypothetical protein [Bacteroidales bacterium]